MDTDGINPKPTHAKMSAIAKAEAVKAGRLSDNAILGATGSQWATHGNQPSAVYPTQLELLQLILATLLRIEGNQTKTAMGPEPEYPRIP